MGDVSAAEATVARGHINVLRGQLDKLDAELADAEAGQSKGPITYMVGASNVLRTASALALTVVAEAAS